MKGLARLCATCFGIGHAPASGTVASLVALPAGLWLAVLGGWIAIALAALAASAAGIWACGVHARATGVEDPSECVIDEVAGQWIALVPLAMTGRLLSLIPLAAAFVLFRLLDIVKPWPVSRLENLPGGWGVMADDIAAGMITAVILYAAIWAGWV